MFQGLHIKNRKCELSQIMAQSPLPVFYMQSFGHSTDERMNTFPKYLYCVQIRSHTASADIPEKILPRAPAVPPVYSDSDPNVPVPGRTGS